MISKGDRQAMAKGGQIPPKRNPVLCLGWCGLHSKIDCLREKIMQGKTAAELLSWSAFAGILTTNCYRKLIMHYLLWL